MKLEDIVIEVRQGDLIRVGQIMHDELDFTATVLFNNVGTWTLRLRDEHPLVPTLRKPGAGLIITGPNGTVLLSGPVVQPTFEATPEDRQGTVTFDGVTDDIILQDYLAWPEPANANVAAQALGADVRQAAAETLMHQYVSANCGPAAPVARQVRNLVMGQDTGRGAVVKQSARFPTLGELLNAIATASAADPGFPRPLGFRIRQAAAQLVFETYETLDRTDLVTLSIRNESIAGQKASVAAPTVTRAIVGGKGELEDRNLIEVSNSLSTDAESEWGRRIEVFVDQRQEEGTDELTQAGDEALADGGRTVINVELIPAENSPSEFGVDWDLGDKVIVDLDDTTEAYAYVSGYAFTISAQEGFVFGATLANVLAVKKATIESRVSQMERVESTGATTTVPVEQSTTFTFSQAATTWSLPHNFNRQSVDVKTFDLNGGELIGDITFTTSNTATVSWFYPTSGSARVTSI